MQSGKRPILPQESLQVREGILLCQVDAYGRQGVFDLAKSPGRRNIHHDVMKFLEESGLYLLCHVTSDDFNQMLQDTHPEGHAPCEDAAIAIKIPF